MDPTNDVIFDPSNALAQMGGGRDDTFAYPLNFLALAHVATGGAPQTATIQIDAASAFFWTALTVVGIQTPGTSAYTNNTLPVPLVTIQIVDGSSNRQLMQAPTFLSALAGDGRLPGRLIHPRLFAKNSLISVTVQSFDGIDYGLLQLVFQGFKRYGV
jgi:hypothetical protein